MKEGEKEIIKKEIMREKSINMMHNRIFTIGEAINSE
jgi:hypothetical protein